MESSQLKKGRKKSSTRSGISINIAHTKYAIIPSVARTLNWRISTRVDLTGDDWDVAWVDGGLGIEKTVRSMLTHQRINHFPGMVELYRKDRLARSIARMRSLCAAEYAFTPMTWCLPADYEAVCSYLRKGSKCVIVKPSSGAQGRGIHLCLAASEVVCHPQQSSIVQSYLLRPLLINGYKFDMRIYVLVTCCDPLRVYLFQEGLCRFCTVPYVQPCPGNRQEMFMHLTNYSINKHNESFVQNEHDDENASKRSLTWLRSYLEGQGISYDQIRADIAHLVVKTLLSAVGLKKAFHDCKIAGQNKNPFTCFELLGLDVILTADLVPVLLEVNHMPSFSTDSSLDHEIKSSLISNTLQLLNLDASNKHTARQSSSLLSQVRLLGDNSLGKKCKEHLDAGQEEQLWAAYLANEADCLGQFDLIYPCNVYENQLTATKEHVYSYLQELAATHLTRAPHSRTPRVYQEDVVSYRQYLRDNVLRDEENESRKKKGSKKQVLESSGSEDTFDSQSRPLVLQSGHGSINQQGGYDNSSYNFIDYYSRLNQSVLNEIVNSMQAHEGPALTDAMLLNNSLVGIAVPDGPMVLDSSSNLVGHSHEPSASSSSPPRSPPRSPSKPSTSVSQQSSSSPRKKYVTDPVAAAAQPAAPVAVEDAHIGISQYDEDDDITTIGSVPSSPVLRQDDVGHYHSNLLDGIYQQQFRAQLAEATAPRQDAIAEQYRAYKQQYLQQYRQAMRQVKP